MYSFFVYFNNLNAKYTVACFIILSNNQTNILRSGGFTGFTGPKKIEVC